MKILLTCASCKLGGVETGLLRLWSGLHERGHETELFFFNHGPFETHVPARIVTHFGTIATLLHLITERSYDIVHGCDWDLDRGLDLVHLHGAPPKLIVTSHGSVCPGWTSANCAALTACASWLSPVCERVTDLRVPTVLNAIDTDRFQPHAGPISGPPIVAWAGRASDLRLKRIDRFAAMAPALVQAGLRLWVASNDKPESVGHALVHEQLVPAVESWRGVPYEQMPLFYRAVAASGGVLLLTSLREGLPAVLLEAQACGCPVVAPAIPGTRDCVRTDQGGVLFPPTMAPADLASLVIATVRDEEGQRRRREACAAYVRSAFTIQRMAVEYERIYQEAPYPVSRRVPLRMRLAILRYRKSFKTWRALVRDKCAAAESLADKGFPERAARIVRSLFLPALPFCVGVRRTAALLSILRGRRAARREPAGTSTGGLTPRRSPGHDQGSEEKWT